MNIKHLLAVIVLSGGALAMAPQQSVAGTFYFRLDAGNSLYSFYPYRYNLWPVYGYHHFSSVNYYSHLHYFFPLISYYQPVYYYPVVPYSFSYSYYPLRFYNHIYSYYRHRPYVYKRYHYPGYSYQRYTYYTPPRQHRDYKHHYTNRDFRHLNNIDPRYRYSKKDNQWTDNKTHKQHKSREQRNSDPAEIAGRLINRNQASNRQQAFRPVQDKHQHERSGGQSFRRYEDPRRSYRYKNTGDAGRKDIAKNHNRLVSPDLQEIRLSINKLHDKKPDTGLSYNRVYKKQSINTGKQGLRQGGDYRQYGVANQGPNVKGRHGNSGNNDPGYGGQYRYKSGERKSSRNHSMSGNYGIPSNRGGLVRFQR